MKRIVVQSDKCIGCRLCEMACSLSHIRELNQEAACVSVLGGPPRRIHICLQCGHKICIDGCLRKALEVDRQTGAIRVVKEKCDGCGKCYLACSNHAIQLENPQGPVRICNLCEDEPQCAAICPTGAISFGEIADIKQEKMAEASGRLAETWRDSLQNVD